MKSKSTKRFGFFFSFFLLLPEFFDILGLCF